ncbi:MAG: hypothetical protein QOF52_2548 [Propionibacteriaceae bacterium]|nr:hypothetical protein [Propionibacteriaceae bacterium]
MSLWDLIWFLFLTYLFVAYLMVMFQIIGDLIRDRDLSGGVKALWFIALAVPATEVEFQRVKAKVLA